MVRKIEKYIASDDTEFSAMEDAVAHEKYLRLVAQARGKMERADFSRLGDAYPALHELFKRDILTLTSDVLWGGE